MCAKFEKSQLECRFLEVSVIHVARKRKFKSFSRNDKVHVW